MNGIEKFAARLDEDTGLRAQLKEVRGNSREAVVREIVAVAQRAGIELSIDELESAFARVVRAVDGPILACLDDPGAARLARRTDARTYGLSTGSDWLVSDVVEQGGRSRFRLTSGATSVAVELPRIGGHMVRNAAGVVALRKKRTT